MTELGQPAIGCTGASKPSRLLRRCSLRHQHEFYTIDDFVRKIINVESSWLFKGRLFDPVGAHSDIWHVESIHLVLSLAEHVWRTLG